MTERTLADSHGLLVVVTTLPNLQDAQSLGRALVEARLAACVQLGNGLHSIYHWEGQICEESEVLLSAKTTMSQWLRIASFIEKNHPYDLPEILAFTPEQYSEQYGAWVSSEVNS